MKKTWERNWLIDTRAPGQKPGEPRFKVGDYVEHYLSENHVLEVRKVSTTKDGFEIELSDGTVYPDQAFVPSTEIKYRIRQSENGLLKKIKALEEKVAELEKTVRKVASKKWYQFWD